MEKMTKVQLLSQIGNLKNNYILGLAAISVLSEPFSVEHLKKSHCAFGSYVIEFRQVAALLGNDADRNIALKEFTTMLIRGLLKESFEIVKSYAKSTNQSAKFKAQLWYHFFRLIRNCVSHNFHFEFSDNDKSLLPVSWRGRTIDTSLDAQPLAITFLGYEGVWDMFTELEMFVIDQLT